MTDSAPKILGKAYELQSKLRSPLHLHRTVIASNGSGPSQQLWSSRAGKEQK
jgi:hypothetical protein